MVKKLRNSNTCLLRKFVVFYIDLKLRIFPFVCSVYCSTFQRCSSVERSSVVQSKVHLNTTKDWHEIHQGSMGSVTLTQWISLEILSGFDNWCVLYAKPCYIHQTTLNHYRMPAPHILVNASPTNTMEHHYTKSAPYFWCRCTDGETCNHSPRLLCTVLPVQTAKLHYNMLNS